MTTILLTRHGQTNWNLSKQYQGWGTVPLNETGLEQARALGEHLATEYNVTTVYASDLLRVQQTVAEIANADGAPDHGEPVPALRERDKGLLQGLTNEEIQAIDPEFRPEGMDGDKVTVAPPDGESYEEMNERVLDWWQTTIENHDPVDGDILVVAHGGSLRCLLAHLDGTPLEEAIHDYATHNCSVTELKKTDDGIEIIDTDCTNFLSE